MNKFILLSLEETYKTIILTGYIKYKTNRQGVEGFVA